MLSAHAIQPLFGVTLQLYVIVSPSSSTTHDLSNSYTQLSPTRVLVVIDVGADVLYGDMFSVIHILNVAVSLATSLFPSSRVNVTVKLSYSVLLGVPEYMM